MSDTVTVLIGTGSIGVAVARRTAVGVGGRAALAAEILDGLAAGDAVIAHPDDQVAEGVRVRAVR